MIVAPGPFRGVFAPLPSKLLRHVIEAVTAAPNQAVETITDRLLERWNSRDMHRSVTKMDGITPVLHGSTKDACFISSLHYVGLLRMYPLTLLYLALRDDFLRMHEPQSCYDSEILSA